MANHENCGLSCVTLSHVGVHAGSHTLLHDISLQLHCGEITAIIGANGAGKTTLLRAILGDIPHSGEIRYTYHHAEEKQKITIGYVPQQLRFDTASPANVLDLLCAAKSRRPVFFGYNAAVRRQAADMLAEVGCKALLRRRLGELSGGELQRVMLALALSPMPDVLILDEPVSGVDARGLEQFYELVSGLRRRYHMAIVLVSHDLSLVAQYADTVILLGGKVLASGSPAEVYATPQFQDVFGRAQYLPQQGGGQK